MDLHSTLTALAQYPGTSDVRPRLFDLSADADRADLERLLARNPPPQVHDTIVAQIHDFLKASKPACSPTAAELAAWSHDLLGSLSLMEHGRWVYYPWSHQLVHVLPREAFRALRSDRNRYK